MSLDTLPGRFAYNEDHEAFRQTVRSFLHKEGVPHVNKWEEDRLVPKEFWRKAGEIGMLCPTVPEAYGGLGLDFGYNAIVDEEMATRACPRAFRSSRISSRAIWSITGPKSRRANGCPRWCRATSSPRSR